jgi:hypothetical protein
VLTSLTSGREIEGRLTSGREGRLEVTDSVISGAGGAALVTAEMASVTASEGGGSSSESGRAKRNVLLDLEQKEDRCEECQERQQEHIPGTEEDIPAKAWRTLTFLLLNAVFVFCDRERKAVVYCPERATATIAKLYFTIVFDPKVLRCQGFVFCFNC